MGQTPSIDVISFPSDVFDIFWHFVLNFVGQHEHGSVFSQLHFDLLYFGYKCHKWDPFATNVQHKSEMKIMV